MLALIVGIQHLHCICVYLLYVGRMSDVFNVHLGRLSTAIADPGRLTMSFLSQKIIESNEQRDIMDTNTTRTTQQRTDFMLSIVSKRLDSNPQKLHTVVDVLYNHHATTDIAREIARDG